MFSHEKLIERCAVRLWHYHSTSRFGQPPKRSWDDLALVEKLRYRRAAEVVLEEISSKNLDGYKHPINDGRPHGSSTQAQQSPLGPAKLSTAHVKLTNREFMILQCLADKPAGANVSILSSVFLNRHPYLAKASARDCLKRLFHKGLCEAVSTKPLKYRISGRGAAVLAENLVFHIVSG